MLHCHAQGGMQRKRRRGDSGANGLKGRGQGAQQCRCCLVIFKIYHSISLIFFLSGQSVTIKPLLIRIIRGRRLFFRGGIFVVGQKKTKKSHPNSCIGCFCLSDVGSRVPPELNLENITSTVGNRWNLKRRW